MSESRLSKSGELGLCKRKNHWTGLINRLAGTQALRSEAEECAWERVSSLRDSPICSTHPVLPCRAFTCRRFAARGLEVLAPPRAFNGSSHARTKKPNSPVGSDAAL